MCGCNMGAMDAQKTSTCNCPKCQAAQMGKFSGKMGYMSTAEIEQEYGVYYMQGKFYDILNNEYVGYYDENTKSIVFDEEAVNASGDGSKFLNFTQGVTNLSRSLVDVVSVFRRDTQPTLTPEQEAARRRIVGGDAVRVPQRRRTPVLAIVAGVLVLGLIIYFVTKK